MLQESKHIWRQPLVLAVSLTESMSNRSSARIGTDNIHSILAWRTANVVYTLANIDNLTIEEARTWAKYGPHWEMVSRRHNCIVKREDFDNSQIFLVSCAPQITSLHTRPQTRSQTRRALTEAGGGNVGTSSHAHDSTNTQGYDPTRAQGGNQNVDRSIAMRGYGNVQNSGSGLSESERDPRSNLRSISNTDTATQQANSEHTTYESRALESLLEHIKKNGGSGQH